MIERLKKKDIHAVYHNVPLHSSPGGMKYGRTHDKLTVTDDLSDRLLRLPLWVGMNEVKAVCAELFA